MSPHHPLGVRLLAARPPPAHPGTTASSHPLPQAAGLDVIVFAITPLALIAPFAGLTIVITFLFSTVGCCGVRETPTKTSFVAVVFITIGVTICSVFGPHDNGSLDPAQLSVFFIIHPGLYILCVLGGAGFFIFSFVTTYFKDSHPAIGEALRSWGGALTLSLVAACFGSLTQLQFKALASALMEGVQDLLDSRRTPTPMYNSPAEFVLQLVAVASSAIAQVDARLPPRTPPPTHASSPHMFFLAPLFCCPHLSSSHLAPTSLPLTLPPSSAPQVGFLNYAISVAPVAYSVPSYQAGLLISTLLLSGWILDEYVLLSPIEAVMFWLGAGVVGCGMLLNAWGLVRAAAAAKGGEGEGGEMEGDVKKGAALLDGAGADAEFGKAASSKFS